MIETLTRAGIRAQADMRVPRREPQKHKKI